MAQDSRLEKAITYIVLVIGAVIMVIPFVWMFLTSFKTYEQSVQIPIIWWPPQWNFDNYAEVLAKLNFGKYYINTIIKVVITVALQLFICSMAAYAFARMRFPFKKLIFFLVLSVYMVPPQMTIIPKYLMMVKLQWVNTFMGLIVPDLFSIFTVFMLRQFFTGLPIELEDAGKIDGCSHFRLYWNINLPLCKTALIAVGVLNTLWSWNELLWPLIVASNENMRVLSVAMATLQGDGQVGMRYNLLMAASMLVLLPMLVMYVIGQKYFIAGIAFSGIKD